MITALILKQSLPLCRDVQYWARLLQLAIPFGLDNGRRWAAFLSQVGHESAQLSRLTENLSYGVRGLLQTWPKRFRAEEFALKFARNPERLANFVYGDRLGNGPMESGDGWRYRGRGLVQVTGRANYAAAGAGLGLDLIARPALLEVPDNAVKSAGYYWQSNGLNELADENNEEAFKAITHRINGGYTGYDERVALWNRARNALGVPIE